MEKEVMFVPKGKNPLEFLSEMGSRTKNCWIYLHKNIVERLKADSSLTMTDGEMTVIQWYENEDRFYTRMKIKNFLDSEWSFVYVISAVDISFSEYSVEPNDLFFIKMEE